MRCISNQKFSTVGAILDVLEGKQRWFVRFLTLLLALSARRGCQYGNKRYGNQGTDGGYVGSKAEHSAINIGCNTAG